MILPRAALLAVFCAAAAAAASPAQTPAAPDYASPASWACDGAAQGMCGGALSTVQAGPGGRERTVPFAPAADPPVDCFYVYPTVSAQPGDHAAAVPEPAVAAIVRLQAARLSAVCRVYAPLYRQVTLAHLKHKSVGGGDPFALPLADIRAAWAYYLANDNHGRGVVLIGHSQGAILLGRLLVQDIQGTPAERTIVAAYLPGDRLLRPGAGGSVGNMEPCRAPGQTGCVVSWSTYLAGSGGAAGRVFARDRPGSPGLCVNPAMPQGGAGTLHPLLPATGGATLGTALVAVPDVTGGCAADGSGTVLQVAFRDPAALQRALAAIGIANPASWGTHVLDVNLVEGDIVSLIGSESKAWAASHRAG